MNLPLRYNIAQNTQYQVLRNSKEFVSKYRQKKGTALSGKVRLLINVLVRIRKRSLFFYFPRSGIRFTLDAFRFVLAPLP